MEKYLKVTELIGSLRNMQFKLGKTICIPTSRILYIESAYCFKNVDQALLDYYIKDCKIRTKIDDDGYLGTQITLKLTECMKPKRFIVVESVSEISSQL